MNNTHRTTTTMKTTAHHITTTIDADTAALGTITPLYTESAAMNSIRHVLEKEQVVVLKEFFTAKAYLQLQKRLSHIKFVQKKNFVSSCRHYPRNSFFQRTATCSDSCRPIIWS